MFLSSRHASRQGSRLETAILHLPLQRHGVVNENRFGFEGCDGYQCIRLGSIFTDHPYQILQAWQSGEFELVVSQEILDEYQRVGKILARERPRLT